MYVYIYVYIRISACIHTCKCTRVHPAIVTHSNATECYSTNVYALHIYEYMQKCTYKYIYINIYIDKNVMRYLHRPKSTPAVHSDKTKCRISHKYIHIHLNIYVSVYIYMYTYICIQDGMCVYVYSTTCIYIDTYTYMHIYVL